MSVNDDGNAVFQGQSVQVIDRQIAVAPMMDWRDY
jgi:hypothetical protein